MEEKRNKKELLAVGLLVFSLVLITVGATFAFFNYSRQGQTENKIKTGNLTFVYDESKSIDGSGGRTASRDSVYPERVAICQLFGIERTGRGFEKK